MTGSTKKHFEFTLLTERTRMYLKMASLSHSFGQTNYESHYRVHQRRWEFSLPVIDQQSIPILEKQAIQAQNPNIQGVSGANYTSAGFEQLLQSALGMLGLS